MRFDLEIPSTDNIKLVFINEGKGIPNSVVSLAYCSIDTKDMFPSDFISVEPGWKPIESSFGGYEEHDGPVILNARSDKFLLTNKIKYKKNNIISPLFYKHVIESLVRDEAIKIVDYYDVELSKENYLTEEFEGRTNIYINKQDKVYFVIYTSENKIKKEFLNISPVFEEASWGDITNGDIAEFHYTYIDKVIGTSCNSKLYISYLSDTKLVRNVCGNIDEPWNIGILNADFTAENGLRYWIPEYYTQKLSSDYRYKLIKDKKCKKIFGGYIKSQYPIAKEESNYITVNVYNYYTKELKGIFTNNKSLVNTLFNSTIYYQPITSFNRDGMIYLPINLEDDDIAFCTHFTDEEYYEYSGVDLNSNLFESSDYFIIYIKPNVTDTEDAIGYAIIGYPVENVSALFFQTIEEFYDAVENDQNSDCYLSYTAAILSITNRLEDSGLGLVDIKHQGNYIANKKELCKVDIDIVYNDIINNSIKIPTNDSLIAEMATERLIANGLFKVDNGELNQFAKDFISNTYKTLKKNLDVSTFPILRIRMPLRDIMDNNRNLITDKYFIGE